MLSSCDKFLFKKSYFQLNTQIFDPIYIIKPMPALPEIAVYVENLNRKLKGSEVKSIYLHKSSTLNISVDVLVSSIQGKTLQAVNRVGKDIEFLFSNSARLNMNLMTSGGFHITKRIEEIDHKIFSLLFIKSDPLTLSDSSGLSMIELNPTLSRVPDPFEVSTEYLKEKISENPRNSIKKTLLDRNIIQGLDNDFTDEILWHSRISPKSVSSYLPEEVLNYLVLKMTSVLEDAIKQIKFTKPDVISGEERSFFSVHTYRRTLTPTGHKIIREKIGFRETFYTDEQILYV